MDEKINIKQALRVFEIITSQGEKRGDEYRLNGITASTDFDGYTVTLRTDYVSLDIFFHNKFLFNAKDNKERTAFMEKIRLIDKTSAKNFDKPH